MGRIVSRTVIHLSAEFQPKVQGVTIFLLLSSSQQPRVDFFAMGDADHVDHDLGSVDLIEDAVVADAYPVGAAASFQSF